MSYSGLHFRYCKVYILKIEIVRIKYKLVNLVLRYTYTLVRWIKFMPVILEKSLRNINAQNLRVILLLEVDFNALYKIIFNRRMMPVLEA